MLDKLKVGDRVAYMLGEYWYESRIVEIYANGRRLLLDNGDKIDAGLCTLTCGA